MNPQKTFIEILIAAMKDAVTEGKLTQIGTQFDPTETGKGPLRKVRLIIVPEEYEYKWPSYAPAGSAGNG